MRLHLVCIARPHIFLFGGGGYAKLEASSIYSLPIPYTGIGVVASRPLRSRTSCFRSSRLWECDLKHCSNVSVVHFLGPTPSHPLCFSRTVTASFSEFHRYHAKRKLSTHVFSRGTKPSGPPPANEYRAGVVAHKRGGKHATSSAPAAFNPDSLNSSSDEDEAPPPP